MIFVKIYNIRAVLFVNAKFNNMFSILIFENTVKQRSSIDGCFDEKCLI
jgi:hypothetical protein